MGPQGSSARCQIQTGFPFRHRRSLLINANQVSSTCSSHY